MPQMAEKTSPDAPPNCAVVPKIKRVKGHQKTSLDPFLCNRCVQIICVKAHHSSS